MRFGIIAPTSNEYADARTLAELAHEAEEAGWDGFFIWDHILYDAQSMPPVVDTWIALTAIALRTTHIRLGPMVTAVARRRPWKLARETVSLDHLAGGRLTLGVGLGNPAEAEFLQFGEEPDARERARKLDEGLQVLVGLWSSQPFHYQGEYYSLRETVFRPAPLQQPRIPIWVGGWWPNTRPFNRAARWDGAFAAKMPVSGRFGQLTPEEVQAVAAYVAAQRTDQAPFDLVCSGHTPGDDPSQAARLIAPYVAAGLTWWLERIHPSRGSFAEMRARIRQEPPQSEG
jgi:alkanesulfonate monooxygenase SsuD/methylene tetrahydromethanopterin reductase-like flavin-dependent oxidoreductase (luciferase family)